MRHYFVGRHLAMPAVLSLYRMCGVKSSHSTKYKEVVIMDTKIDLEHIKSLKAFSREDREVLGQNRTSASTEDPTIFMVRYSNREGLAAYLIFVGERRFAFGIDTELAKSLKTYEDDNLMNIWIDQILCDFVDFNPRARSYINYATESTFSSTEERDVIIDLFERLIVSLGRPDPTVGYPIWPKRARFTERATEQLAAYEK